MDFQETRVGGGVRWTTRQKLAVEFSGGWTLARQFNFHQRDLELQGDGAPYVQIGLGLKF